MTYRDVLRNRRLAYRNSGIASTGTDWTKPLIACLPVTRGKNNIPTVKDFARSCGFLYDGHRTTGMFAVANTARQ